MRRIELRMNEQYKYEIVKKLVDTGGNKLAAERKLNVSRRTLDRYIVGYKNHGKAFFIHGNRNRKPSHSHDQSLCDKIVDLYMNKYYDANITHFTELLGKYESINVSVSFVQKLLTSQDILSPKARKKTKRAMIKRLKESLSGPVTRKDKQEIDRRIYELEQVHPRRPRSAYYGELIQMDASDHVWFGDVRSHLHAAIDDATGRIVGAFFDDQETLKGYYNVMHQILSSEGIPMKILTDNRTVFNYIKGGKGSMERDSFTQFAYACHQLGTALETSSIPQVKGRVERLFQTLQSRLVVELRLAGISSITEANEFLISYIRDFNNAFALDATHLKSVFDDAITPEEINLNLASFAKRKIDSGHSIKFKNKYYALMDKAGDQAYFPGKTKVMVITAFDGSLFASVDDKVFSLKYLPRNQEYSSFVDFLLPEKEKSPIIPDRSHPWHYDSLSKFMKNNQLRDIGLSFSEVANTQAVLY